MPRYRTDLRAWQLDMLDFIIEQIELARSPSDQFSAVDAAHGIVPCILSRLEDDVYLKARFMLAFGDLMFSGHWKEIWVEMAKEASDRFAKSADNLIERVNTAKEVLGQPLPQSK